VIDVRRPAVLDPADDGLHGALGTAPVPVPTEDQGQPSPVRPMPAVVAAVLGLAGVLVLALVVGGARPTVVPPGLPQPGPLVDWGLPVVRLAGRIAALGTVGTLLFAAVLLPGTTGQLPAASRRALRTTSHWALGWATATAVGGVLTASDLVGAPPASLTAASLRTFVTDVPAGRAAVVVLAITGVLALVARRCHRPATAGVLLVVALAGVVVPAVLAGHSASAADHVLAVTTLSAHVVSASLWVGGLLALLLYGLGGDVRVQAAARFSAVALGCFVATGASGLLAAWLVLGGSAAGLAAVVGTGYGWLLAGKTAALVALGVFGWQHRRRTLPRLRAGERRSFARFAGVEAAVLLATVVLGVALSAAPPPPSASGAAASTPAGAPAGRPDQPAADPADTGADPMAGHDHGELSVTVLIDEGRFHVSGSVEAGSRVTVHNPTTLEVTITAEDGSFDVVVPGRTLTTFVAPEEAGEYTFSSRHSASFADVLVVR
jgi:putative copper export protein